jgi:hypothetical protein
MNKYQQAFADKYPKAIDFKSDEYKSNKAEIDEAAKANKYHMAGERLGFVVFSTKPQ